MQITEKIGHGEMGSSQNTQGKQTQNHKITNTKLGSVRTQAAMAKAHKPQAMWLYGLLFRLEGALHV